MIERTRRVAIYRLIFYLFDCVTSMSGCYQKIDNGKEFLSLNTLKPVYRSFL